MRTRELKHRIVAADIERLASTIENAMNRRIEELAFISAQGFFKDWDGSVRFQSPTIQKDLDELAKVEREAKRELLKRFAELFYDLHITREWAAIELALRIMEKQEEW